MFYRERLLGVISMFDDKRAIKKNPEVKVFSRALDNKFLTAYTYYEMILPDKPILASYLSEAVIKDIVEYIKQIRGSKK
jgi:hypothetical protein